MDQIKQIIIEVENLKLEQNFSKAIELIEKNLISYNSDYRLYEELADIYIYK
ncbi:MAG: hypothetical protein LBQ24_07730 [Candidatus Peribacteria bacterium]|jgi:hypothetical protein|nr:hypothetical protein [Candidatus Peribacteria bacterium]